VNKHMVDEIRVEEQAPQLPLHFLRPSMQSEMV
jgi:hypothetical protein